MCCTFAWIFNVSAIVYVADSQAILKIDNLSTFIGLRKLQLDNNLIEKIENLDLLVNLEWLGAHSSTALTLDLSFNHITAIEGLEKLGKLTDLSLAYNRITRLERLEPLKKLDVLSISGNLIESLEVRCPTPRFAFLF